MAAKGLQHRAAPLQSDARARILQWRRREAETSTSKINLRPSVGAFSFGRARVAFSNRHVERYEPSMVRMRRTLSEGD